MVRQCQSGLTMADEGIVRAARWSSLAHPFSAISGKPCWEETPALWLEDLEYANLPHSHPNLLPNR